MPQVSAGILMYRVQHDLQVLLVHPGGPYFRNKDEGAWTIPKGEVQADEELLTTARRDFFEETGVAPSGPFIELRAVKQKGGKVVHAWATLGDLDPAAIVSNTFQMEWPPKSGRVVKFAEVDRAEWFGIDEAGRKINPAQLSFLQQLAALVDARR